jgi:MFS family permease
VTRAAAPGFLDRERSFAGPGFNRWLVPPCALAVHLCIGMAYGFSVFWLPLSKALAGRGMSACPATMGLLEELVATGCDWRIASLAWIYTLFFVVLGSAAALFGGWLERAGPRRAGVVAAVCWCAGLVIAALGVRLHQLWLLWLGPGLVGGVGLGLGYISPVSTLIKWFPDRRGMATGMAIMGFGGGAMIGSPLADLLMRRFATPDDVGVAATFLALAALYLAFMLGGALGYRIPPPGWLPPGFVAGAAGPNAVTRPDRYVPVGRVLRIPQFWLLWLVLCMNVSAGIGVLGMASPMLQEVFGGRLIGSATRFADLDPPALAAIATVAAGFTALLSLFNIGGRFFWASLSDRLGRRLTFSLFFLLGGVLYASVPLAAAAGSRLAFVAALCVILSMYGGGFATVPAYLADLFGTQMVGAIHGRLLTAWATAGVLGPVVVTRMREYQLSLGLPREQVYDQTMYILAGMLAVGFVCNLLIRPVAAHWFVTPGELAAERRAAGEPPPPEPAPAVGGTAGGGRAVALAWLAVGLPLAWGVYRTLLGVAKFFG